MRSVRHPDRGQLAGAEQRGQDRRVAAVGLDVSTRPHGHHGRRHHLAVITHRTDLAVKPVAGGPGLVAEGQPMMLFCQLLHQLAHRLRPVGDGAEEAHLTASATPGDPYRERLFARIEGHVRRILVHGSSPMFEALTGAARSTLDTGMQRDEPPPQTTDMGSQALR